MSGNDLYGKYETVYELGNWAIKLKKRTNHAGKKPFLTYNDKEVAGLKTIDHAGNMGLKVLVDGLVIPVNLLNSLVLYWINCKNEVERDSVPIVQEYSGR